jgi:hypothetical protein
LSRPAKQWGVTGNRLDRKEQIVKLGEKVVVLCAAAIVVSTGLLVTAAASSAAEDAAAVKATLIHGPLSNCQLGADAIPGTGTPTSGFALIVHGPQGVHATVVLRDGRPDATYTVYLIETVGVPSGPPMDCLVPDATLMTNHAGTGVALIRESLLPGALYVHAYLYTLDGGFDYFDTALVPVS